MKQYLIKHLLKDLFLENIHPSDQTITKRETKNLAEDPIVQKIINLPDKLSNLNANNIELVFFFALLKNFEA